MIQFDKTNEGAGITRRLFSFGLCLAPGCALAQGKRPAPPSTGPGLSASRSLMAGSPLTVMLSRAPAGARLAIARAGAPADRAILVLPVEGASTTLPTPGLAGRYELRLMADRDGTPVILLSQPLETTQPSATLAAPERVGAGQDVPVRGIGPNGGQDYVTIVAADAAPEAEGPLFFPAENVEATLEAPASRGRYELRYVLDAPLSGRVVLARRPIVVE